MGLNAIFLRCFLDKNALYHTLAPVLQLSYHAYRVLKPEERILLCIVLIVVEKTQMALAFAVDVACHSEHPPLSLQHPQQHLHPSL